MIRNRDSFISCYSKNILIDLYGSTLANETIIKSYILFYIPQESAFWAKVLFSYQQKS